MAGKSPEYTGVSNLKLMVVEDDPFVAPILSLLLESIGHSPVLFRTPEEAIKGFIDGELDGVLTDFNMSGMDGITMVKQLRLKTEKPLPAILITGRPDNLNHPDIGEIQVSLLKPSFVFDNGLARALSDPGFQAMVKQRRGIDPK